MRKELLELVGKNFELTKDRIDRIDHFLECKGFCLK